MKNFIILLVFLSSVSCAKEEVKTSAETSFFDITVFVDSILADKPIQSEVRRNISINDETEEKILTEVEMTKILGFLKQFNINRPRWYDKYHVEREGNSISYTSQDEDLDVKKMMVVTEKEKVAKIDILYKSQTLISSSEKNISWKPGTSLSLKNTSRSLWSAEQNMHFLWNYSSGISN